MASARAKTTTERGLGWAHQKQRKRLLARHRDGSPCPCLTDDACGPACPCRPAGIGLPMYRDAERNVDGMPLEADHTVARSLGGKVADRLLLATCNRSRQDGTRVPLADDPTLPGQTMLAPAWWSRPWYPTSTPPGATTMSDPTPGASTPGHATHGADHQGHTTHGAATAPTTHAPGARPQVPTPPRRVLLLVGPPGAGKTTLALGTGLPVYDRDDHIWPNDRAFRDAIATLAHDPHAQAVVIRSCPTSRSRAQVSTLIRATGTYLLMPERRECERRVARRGREDKANTLSGVRRWFEQFDHNDDVRLVHSPTDLVDNPVENPGPRA